MKTSIAAFALLSILMGGCNGLGSLGDLEGTYDLAPLVERTGRGELVACELVVDRHGGDARCERTSAMSPVFHEELTLDLSFDDDAIDAEIVYLAETNDHDDGCYVRSCTTTMTGEAARSQGRDVERGEPFKAAAGEWDGTVVVEEQCTTVANPDASRWCDEAEDTLRIDTYTFGASVFGSFAMVEWLSQERSGAFDVVGYGDLIEVDGVAIPQR